MYRLERAGIDSEFWVVSSWHKRLDDSFLEGFEDTSSLQATPSVDVHRVALIFRCGVGAPEISFGASHGAGERNISGFVWGSAMPRVPCHRSRVSDFTLNT